MQNKTLPPIDVVLCMQEDGGIGLGLNLLYKSKELPGDMQRFIDLTMDKVLIMGRKTWLSIPSKYRKFDGRFVIVITRNPNDLEDTEKVGTICGSLIEAIHYARTNLPDKGIVCGGGGNVYEQIFPYTTNVYLTIVKSKRPADIIVTIPEYFVEVSRVENTHAGLDYNFMHMRKRKNPEEKYAD